MNRVASNVGGLSLAVLKAILASGAGIALRPIENTASWEEGGALRTGIAPGPFKTLDSLHPLPIGLEVRVLTNCWWFEHTYILFI